MKDRLFDFYASRSWAVLPEWLQEMYDIYRAAIDRRGVGIDFDPEALSAKAGRPLDNTRKVEMRGGTAIIPVLGPIFPRANLFTQISNATSVDVLATDFNSALENPSVHSIILNIDSPGGAVDGISEFAQMVFDARGKKPIISYAGNLAASAGCWIFSAAGEGVIGNTASLGSIGVVGGVSVAKDKDRVEFVSSQSPNKRPDPSTEAGRAQFQAHVDALADVFVNTIARNRGMSAEDVISKAGSGGLKVGQQAVDAGLADRLGSLESLIAEMSTRQGRDDHMEKIKKKKMIPMHSEKMSADSQIGANEMADEKTDATKETQPPVADPPKADAVQAPKAAADNSAEVETLKADKAKAEEDAKAKATELAAEKQAREALESRVAAMEKDARTSRFTTLAKDWSGEKAFHLDMLEMIAITEKDGEKSARFTKYVEHENAVAEQLRQSALFKEIGSGEAAEGSAEAEVEAKVRALCDADPKLTRAQAFDKVWSENPTLRNRYRSEQRVN